MQVVICGPPGSGKTTQCRLLAEKNDLVALNVRYVVQAAVEEGTACGVKAKAVLAAGKLLPDQLMADVLAERIGSDDCRRRGWVLDGFPSNTKQAVTLTSAGVNPSAVIMLRAEEETVLERCSLRRCDPDTGKVYHLKYNPPPDDPELLERLEQQTEDTEESIKRRTARYRSGFAALVEHYGGACHTVNAAASESAVMDECAAALSGASFSGSFRQRAASLNVSAPRIVVFGPPGCGKTTQCVHLARLRGLVLLSAREVAQAAVEAGTAKGREAKAVLDAGKLLPDQCDPARPPPPPLPPSY